MVETLERITVSSIGGALYGTKLTSAWNDSLMTSFNIGYNNKAGNTIGSYDGRFRDKPGFRYFQINPVVGAGAPRRSRNAGVVRRHAGDQRLHLLPADRIRNDAHGPR